jgi:hypothetical protein
MSVANALSGLQKQSLAAAGRFQDYNFRSYFVSHTEDKFAAVAKLDDAAIIQFVAGAGAADLKAMERMATMNGMFSETPVIVEGAATK